MKNRFENCDWKPGHVGNVNVGSFLIATPVLDNTPFRKTVVFVLQHNDQGTFGVVLNRPAGEKLKHAWRQLTGATIDDRCIVQGGPIGGPIFAIHRDQSLGELEMPGGIFVSSDAEKFPQLLELDESKYRIVFGVAGWQAGQLSDEIAAGSWFQLAVSPVHVFDDPSFMWENFIREYGRQLLSDVVGVPGFPGDPQDN